MGVIEHGAAWRWRPEMKQPFSAVPGAGLSKYATAAQGNPMSLRRTNTLADAGRVLKITK
jgi:hypothetical protein